MRARARGCIIQAAVTAAFLAALSAPAPALAAPSFGSLTQLAGPFGCVNDDAGEGCDVGGALEGAASVAVSPDGRNVYAAANNSGAVTVFRRNRRSGVIAARSCIGNAPLEGCASARGMAGAFSVAVSPDGRNVYVAAFRGVAAFTRNPRSGDLTQLEGGRGCVSQDGGDGCAQGRALVSPAALTVSPGGRNLYVASSGSNGIAVFARNPDTGVITQLRGPEGCVSQAFSLDCISGRALGGAFSVGISPNGRHAYVAALTSNAIAVFERDPDDGALFQLQGANGCVSQGGSDGCAAGRGLDGPNGVSVTADGRNVYAASSGSGAVTAFARDDTDGRLLQLKGAQGCTSQGGTEGCATGRALRGAYAVTTSIDGANAYVASSTAVISFPRDGASGALAQLEEPDICTSQGGSENCVIGRGLLEPSSIALPADGRNAYVASYSSDAVATFARNPQRTRVRIVVRGRPRRCAKRAFDLRVRVRSRLPIRQVGVSLNRRRLGRRDGARRLTVRIAARRLRAGRHRFRVRAVDVGGNRGRRTVGFERCGLRGARPSKWRHPVG